MLPPSGIIILTFIWQITIFLRSQSMRFGTCWAGPRSGYVTHAWSISICYPQSYNDRVENRHTAHAGSVTANPSIFADTGKEFVKFVAWKPGTAGWHICYHVKWGCLKMRPTKRKTKSKMWKAYYKLHYCSS